VNPPCNLAFNSSAFCFCGFTAVGLSGIKNTRSVIKRCEYVTIVGIQLIILHDISVCVFHFFFNVFAEDDVFVDKVGELDSGWSGWCLGFGGHMWVVRRFFEYRKKNYL
jgi:hypothetical protein